MTKEEINTVIELFISWNGETKAIDVANLDSAVDYIHQCIRPLQSDVTKAAKDYARCYTESDNGNGGDDWEDDISIAFTAGAQWLAEKGVTMSIDDNTEWADVDSFVHRNVDNKTVIQIR